MQAIIYLIQSLTPTLVTLGSDLVLLYDSVFLGWVFLGIHPFLLALQFVGI